MPEATEGGSDILPVSSTSKLSADVGMSEMEFIAMKDSDPAAALKMLLSSKGNKEQSKGASQHSSSTASDTEISSTVRYQKENIGPYLIWSEACCLLEICLKGSGQKLLYGQLM
jgi:hypothetical protein